MKNDVGFTNTSDTRTSDGDVSDSGTNGTNGNANGTSGNVNGTSGNADGSNRGEHGSNGNDSAERNDGNEFDTPNVYDINGNQNIANSDASTGNGRGFGDAIRDRVTGNESNGRSAGTEEKLDNEFVIGLGKKQRGRPRNSNNKETSNRSVSARETKDLISVFIGTLFEIPAITLKADFWRLTDAENDTITSAVVTWIDSLPKSKSNKFTKWLAENMPIVNLSLVGFFILGDRTKQTIDLLKSRKTETIPENTKATVQKNGGVSIPINVQTGGMVF